MVFRRDTSKASLEIDEPQRETLGTLLGPWNISFQPERGAPNQATFLRLESWSDNSDRGIKYFSGTASYEIDLEVPPYWILKDHRMEIDLGTVKNIAEVLVDGKSAGFAWKHPYRVDLTDFVKPGNNHLVVRVTNLWVNRLIGDKRREGAPVTPTTFNPYSSDSPLINSGLLGPVTLQRVRALDRP